MQTLTEGATTDRKRDLMLAQLARMPRHRQLAIQQLQMRLVLWRLGQRIDGWLKRGLDISVALIALVLLLPLMLLTALAVKLDSPGPILFRQIRVGRFGRTFACLKFRSMYVDAEERLALLQSRNDADGPVFKMRRDPRITRVGRIIRKLSIDELPQLWNVLCGEMSLVGPRPALPREVLCYTPHQIRRLDVIPGITGLQQVSGRSNLDFERWIALDLQYIAEQSIWQDLKILLLTIPTVITGRGAY